jgi:hypothetical protein
MANITGDYWQFYLDGRREGRLLKHDIAEDALVEEMVRTGASFRNTISAACGRAAAPLESGKIKKRWVTDHENAIRIAGGDADLAYSSYLQGRVDELGYALEQDVVDAMEQHFGDEDEDEDEDED